MLGFEKSISEQNWNICQCLGKPASLFIKSVGRTKFGALPGERVTTKTQRSGTFFIEWFTVWKWNLCFSDCYRMFGYFWKITFRPPIFSKLHSDDSCGTLGTDRLLKRWFCTFQFWPISVSSSGSGNNSNISDQYELLHIVFSAASVFELLHAFIQK